MIVVVVIGAVLPGSSIGPTLDFATLPLGFFLVLVVFVVAYLASVELGKVILFKAVGATTHTPLQRDRSHRVQRIAARWSHHAPLPEP
jgi:Mg2+-importing ATPase